MSNASRFHASASLCVVAAFLSGVGCDTSEEDNSSTTAALKAAPFAKTAVATSDARTTVTVQVPPASVPVTYEPWAIELDVKETPIAAYQVELIVRSGDATIVGVEGGTTDGFRDPPYYDPQALAGGRIVLAAFNTKVALSPGRHRVATVHMREAGAAPVYELRLTAAAGPDGVPAAADINLVSGKGAE
jgi:hypothetical protein